MVFFCVFGWIKSKNMAIGDLQINELWIFWEILLLPLASRASAPFAFDNSSLHCLFGSIRTRKIDSPSWLAPLPNNVLMAFCESFPSQALEHPNPSIVWSCCAIFTCPAEYTKRPYSAINPKKTNNLFVTRFVIFIIIVNVWPQSSPKLVYICGHSQETKINILWKLK